MYLNCKTYFSFRYGTFSTEDLVKEAAEYGANVLALTNINNTCDTWDFVDFCRQQNIKPVTGVEIRNDDTLLYILLAKNSAGFSDINFFISEHLQQKVNFPERPVFSNDVFIIYPLGKLSAQELKTNELIGVQPVEVNKLFGTNVSAFPSKFVIRQPVTFRDKVHFNLHRLLRAIHKNTLLSKQTPAEIAGANETFIPQAKLMEAFRQYPFIITNTLQVLDSCGITIDFNTDKTKKVFSASKKDDRILLEKLTLDGMQMRFGKNNKEARSRVRKELEIIDNMGFNAYFLITWDIIRYAQSRGFFYVGRGSGANSIVAYCLQITDVNPIDLDLYFERFLNPHRTSPPDFDIDFSWKDRDEVIDYIFKRYGKDHVALLGMYTTFQYRAVIRELGKVFGLPKKEIDVLAGNRSSTFTEDKIQKLILQYGAMLKDFPNHLSIHPGGMLISEEPIYHYTALDLPPKEFSTSQLDMFIAEKVGLYKLDILSQRGLGHIKETVRLVKQNKGKSIDITDVQSFMKDKKVADQIRDANTIGCFYIESPAMRQLLKKLKCEDYLTLVAASSIIRPGVSQSGMMRQYIYRFHHPNDFEYLHPKMEELLKETYGVMVYQEDVIKVAHHFAGLDMAEADVLRRAMSGKYRTHSKITVIREKFFENCRSFGYPEAITSEVWRQIESFGGYSFSKAHSASFAVESYQSLYLKTYFPMEFMVAVINNHGGFYRSELYFHELKKTGAKVHPPCVNQSDELTNISGDDVHIGLEFIQNLESQTIETILRERNKNGPFTDLNDFIERTNVKMEQLNVLIRINALRFTGKNKKELLWAANFQVKKNKVTADQVMFHEAPIEFNLPALAQHDFDDAMDEIEILGFPLCNAFDLADAADSGYTLARDLPNHTGKEVNVLGYLICIKEVYTVKREIMYFGTFIDSAGAWLDTVHFPSVNNKYPLESSGFYNMKGKVVEEFGVYSVEVTYLSKVGLKR
ncbi:MAG TPA: DNA polymerase III subunit alpha [Chitinophagaceae bacterium]